MQTLVWHALRTAAAKSTPTVCRSIAGRRFASPKRSFHVPLRRRRQDEPTEPHELPEAAQNHIINQLLPEQSEESQEGEPQDESQEVTEGFSGAPPGSSGAKDPGPYGSASRRAYRNVKRPPAQPPHLPTWFLEGNVTLREENDANPKDVYQGGGLERKASVQDAKAGDDLRSSDGRETHGAGKSAEKDALYSIDTNVFTEIRHMLAAGLNIPRDPDNASSARPHIVLHCPQEGGTFFLDSLTKQLAMLSDADVVRIDAQDIAEVGGRYLRDFKDIHGNTLSALSYEAYLPPPSREAQESDETLEDEGEDAEEEDDRRRPRSTALGKPIISEMRVVPVQVMGGSIADMLNSIRGGGGMPSGKPPRPFAQPPTQNPDTSLDAKISLFIEALMSATEVKRRKQFSTPGTVPISEGTKSNGVLLMSLNSHPELTSSADLNPEPKIEKSTVFQESPSTSLIKYPSPKLIVHVRDYHEINSTYNGSRILERLHEIIQRKRSEGQRVIVLGTTTADDLLPSPSKSGLRHAQSDQGNTFTRTVVAPSIAPSAEAQFAEEAKTRIEDINMRHLRDMLRRISPDPFQVNTLLAEPKLELDSQMVFSAGLDESVWSMDRIHRVATLALGRLGEHEEMKAEDIEGALSLIDMSDTSKVAFLEKEAAVERQRSNSIHRDPTSTAINIEDRTKKLRKTCNAHEKKLLHGVIDPSAIRTTFSDVRAPPETVEALKTLTSLSLVRPDAFTYGVLATDRIPGLLLYGPPGTGKTLLAKAVAKESGATVLEVSGSDVYDMYVGEGEKNIRAIFTLAKKLTPCIVFIDEADAILGSRGGSANRTTHRELINQFLREWDGMTETSAFIMVATNRPFDLDEASLRRLPRRLLVDLPTEKDREVILKIHLKDEILAPDVSLASLASQTPFYSGSDLKNVAVAAALSCVREEIDSMAAASHSTSTSTIVPEPVSTTPASSPESDSPFTPDSSPSLSVPELHPQASGSSNPTQDSSTLPSTPASNPETNNTPTSPPYTYPAKRTLELRHFKRALEEISASISEDMGSLSAIRKFDEKYGDRRGRRKKLGGYGFETVKEGEKGGDGAARVRNQS